MTKQIVAFNNFAKALKNCPTNLYEICCLTILFEVVFTSKFFS